MERTLKIRNYLPSSISTREAVKVIGENLNYDQSIVFDFESVDFISRAFADELIKLIMDKKVNARFINTNSDIIQLLDIVNKTSKERRSDTHHTLQIQFPDKHQLHEFLTSID